VRGNALSVVLEHIDLERGGRRVLRDVSWRIGAGERWVLVGANGAGKTQLLKLLAGAVWPKPTRRGSRRYLWRGEILKTPYGVQEEIAYVGSERQDRYERYGWNFSVERLVGTGLHRTDIPLDPLSRADHAIVARLLARLGIEDLRARRFLTLSYGERRLVLLARALASKPRLLLLDELLNGLDAGRRDSVLQWLERTSRSRAPWVFATHRLNDVPRNATHALVLERGRVVYRGHIRGARLERRLGAPVKRNARSARAVCAGEPLVALSRANVYLGERRALRDVTLEIRPRQCWVVHGPNGSGKTTLLRTLYGDHGVAARGRVARRGIVRGVPLYRFQERVGLVAPHLHTEASLHTPDPLIVAPRSYGQMRRRLFAHALGHEPELLLLDEPFAGLDVGARRALAGRISRCVSRGAAVVVATHDREDWPERATHELELEAGRVRYRGPLRRMVSMRAARSSRATRSLRAARSNRLSAGARSAPSRKGRSGNIRRA
jgi:molybdate transport system ATP-binding protein